MMNKELVTIMGEELQLIGEKAVFWTKEKMLIISDVHLGKVNHFRKAGIPVPSKANQKNIEVLIQLLQDIKPERVIFLGDLFHSSYNQEWEVLGQVLDHFPDISFELVKGNHDILGEHQYVKHKIKLHELYITREPFIFTHEPLAEIPMGFYALAGHIHPGVLMKGKGRQRLRLPCFWFGKDQGLLPAFGEFTGLHIITPGVEDEVYLVIGGKILKK